MKRLHLSLGEELEAALMGEVRVGGQSATALVREAIERLLAERKRQALDTALNAYIQAEGGGPHDLDEALEAEALALQKQELELAYEQYAREYPQDEQAQAEAQAWLDFPKQETAQDGQ